MTLKELITTLLALDIAGHGDKEVVLATWRGDQQFCEPVNRVKQESVGESDMYNETVIVTDTEQQQIDDDISNQRDAVVIYTHV